ncbi:MAG: hypothetical protein E7585_06545 [Ruminococcaceae bacterium]|nr:hypothetical protein [Oscillospiraceae bacterium]
MSYKIELHCHNLPVSICAHIEPEAQAAAYIETGYNTVVLTNHLSAATFRHMADASWDQKIDHYLFAYRRMRAAAGDKMTVLLGAEICPDCYCATDFLVFGMTEAFLRAYPDLLATDVATLSQRIRAAGMRIYQAHPFRNRMVVIDPKHLDGIEVYNAQRREASRNDFAALWAKRYGLPGIAGSDNHRGAADAVSGILTQIPVPDNKTLLQILSTKEYQLLRGGDPGKE